MALPLAAAVVFGVSAYQFSGPTAYDYYPGVIDLPTAALAGDRVECEQVRERMAPLRGDPAQSLQGAAEPYFLDQRLGQPILLVPFYLLFGQLGFRIAFALLRVGILLGAFHLCLALSGVRWVSLVCALLVVLNPYMLSIRTLDPNVLAVALVMFSFLCVLQGRGRRWSAAAAGLAWGVLAQVAHVFMAVLALPALVAGLLAWTAGMKPRLVVLGVFFLAAAGPLALKAGLDSRLVETAPATLHVCLGDLVLVDASQGGTRSLVPQAEGWGPGSVPAGPDAKDAPGRAGGAPPSLRLCSQTPPGWHLHDLGPLHVNVWGMLNWPFHDSWIRSGFQPLPFALLMPAKFLHFFGVLFSALCLLGLLLALRRPDPGSPARGLGLFLLLEASFLAVQANLGGHKLEFALWVLLPLALFAAPGLAALRDLRPWRPWALFGGLVLLLAWGVTLLGQAYFPLDERWVTQFGWKGFRGDLAAVDARSAERRLELLSQVRLLPSGEYLETQPRLSPPVPRQGALLAELAGQDHPSSTQAWRTWQSVELTPPGALVLVNPYLEVSSRVLGQEERCVVKAKAFAPGYDRQLTEWMEQVIEAYPEARKEFYLVDSVRMPILGHMKGFSGETVGFSGDQRMVRVTRSGE
jgi:hypothetical protein